MRLRYCLMFFPLMGAIACAFFGAQAFSLSARSSQTPEEISLRDLIKRGPVGNPNIILKDFSIFDDYVYEKKFVSGKWTKVWVPIVPTSGTEEASEKPAIRAFLFSEDIGSDKEVRQRFDRPTMRGMVSPDAPKPGIVGSLLIDKKYPGTKPETCLIIVEGKEPASTLKLILYGVGTMFLLGLIGGIWYLGRLFDKMPVDPKGAVESRPSRRRENDGLAPTPDVLPADNDG